MRTADGCHGSAQRLVTIPRGRRLRAYRDGGGAGLGPYPSKVAEEVEGNPVEGGEEEVCDFLIAHPDVRVFHELFQEDALYFYHVVGLPLLVKDVLVAREREEAHDALARKGRAIRSERGEN